VDGVLLLGERAVEDVVAAAPADLDAIAGGHLRLASGEGIQPRQVIRAERAGRLALDAEPDEPHPSREESHDDVSLLMPPLGSTPVYRLAAGAPLHPSSADGIGIVPR